MGTKKEYYEAVDDLIADSSARSAPAYSEAFSKSIKVTPKMQALFRHPAMQKATKAAVTRMKNEPAPQVAPAEHSLAKQALGISDDQPLTMKSFMDDIDEVLTTRTIKKPPELMPGHPAVVGGRPGNTKYFDFVKRELDNKIGLAVRAGADDDVRQLTLMKKALVNEIDKQNPAYATARKIFSDRKSVERAIEQGSKFIRGEGEATRRMMLGMSTAERDGFRIGVMRGYKNYIGGVKDTNSIAQRFQNPAMRERIKAVMPDDESYNEFMGVVDTWIKRGDIRNKVLAGSPTAQRQISAGDVAVDVATQGKWALPSLVKAGLRRATAPPAAVSAEIARLLTSGTIPQIQQLAQPRVYGGLFPDKATQFLSMLAGREVSE
jgi:hypothetical protein